MIELNMCHPTSKKTQGNSTQAILHAPVVKIMQCAHGRLARPHPKTPSSDYVALILLSPTCECPTAIQE